MIDNHEDDDDVSRTMIIITIIAHRNIKSPNKRRLISVFVVRATLFLALSLSLSPLSLVHVFFVSRFCPKKS